MGSMRTARAGAPAALAAVSAVAALALAGCTASATSATSATSAPEADRTVSGSPFPSSSASAEPRLVYTGTARQNLPFFDLVNQRLIAKGGTPRGRDFVDALVAAGFAKTAMQVTRDTTTVGLQADNIQFSVAVNGDCLIGQYGNIGYASTVQPELNTGRCLAGDTRPIDW